MNYFIAQNLGVNVTGIEKSQINRLQLFEDAGESAKCIYTNFNPRLHQNAAAFGIEGKCFSLYDYFQDTIDFDETKRIGWIHRWVNQNGYRIAYVPKSYDIRIYDENNLFIMYAHFDDETYTSLVYLNYFDRNGQKVKREFYDSRGFLSKINLLRKNQEINTELFLDRSGRIKIEKYYQLSDEHVNQLNKIVLKNYNDRDYFFNTEMAFEIFFFDCLFTESDVIFCDRNRTLAEPLSKTKKSLQICSVFHSTHALDQEDVMNSSLKRVYSYVLKHPEKFKRILVSTNQQKDDLIERFPGTLPQIEVIPVGFTGDRSVDTKVKQKNKIIGVARYSVEKQLLHQIDAVACLVEEFPDIELHLFGFGNEEKVLKDRINEKNLERNVFIRGFTTNLWEEYASSSLCILTSLIEGFSLALLEAQEASVPIISYNVRYGPGELIKDGQNGFLVEANNQEMLVEKMREYLSNAERQEAMMQASHENAQRYHKEVLIQKWQKFLNDLSPKKDTNNK